MDPNIKLVLNELKARSCLAVVSPSWSQPTRCSTIDVQGSTPPWMTFFLEIDATMHQVVFVVGAPSSAGILANPGMVAASSSVNNLAIGPDGHHLASHHWELEAESPMYGFG
jgi:hypothetical protein